MLDIFASAWYRARNQHKRGVRQMRYDTSRRVAGITAEGEKALWQKIAKEEGFTSLWQFVLWVVRQYIKEREKEK